MPRWGGYKRLWPVESPRAPPTVPWRGLGNHQGPRPPPPPTVHTKFLRPQGETNKMSSLRAKTSVVNSWKGSRSSSREARVRVPFFSVVYFCRGNLPPKKIGKRALLGDLGKTSQLGLGLSVNHISFVTHPEGFCDEAFCEEVLESLPAPRKAQTAHVLRSWLKVDDKSFSCRPLISKPPSVFTQGRPFLVRIIFFQESGIKLPCGGFLSRGQPCRFAPAVSKSSKN